MPSFTSCGVCHVIVSSSVDIYVKVMSLFKSQEWVEEHSHLICSKRELLETLFPKPAFVVGTLVASSSS